jgi:hypothetical protein
MNDQDIVKEQSTPELEIAPMQNMDQFAFLMSSWFEDNHKQAQHFMTVPDGQSLTIKLDKDKEAEELILTGDTMKGFKAGMIVMMSIFDRLPFESFTTTREVQAETGNASDATTSEQ